MRPAHLVDGRGGSEVLEWNSLQGIDAIEKKYPDCGDITGDIGDTLKQFKTSPLVPSGNFLANECARDIHMIENERLGLALRGSVAPGAA